jgi:aryl-alcohol dehydrogenase-like predicted oxidoreductase
MSSIGTASTANAYTGGQSEEVVSRAVRGRRDQVVIASKAYVPQGPGPNERGLSRVHLTRALEASLRRLGTDHVDLYQCHWWDADTPIEETMATLDGFVRSGKVRYLGCSNFSASEIVEAQWAAERIGGTPLVSLQPQYSLLVRDIEAEILPVCRLHGLGTLVYSPLGGGVLAARYRRGADPDPGTRVARYMTMQATRHMAQDYARDLLSDRNLEIADEVTKVAAELGTTPAAVALAWVRRRPGVTSIIVGPRTLEQYEQNMPGFELALPDETASRLDEISQPEMDVPVTGAPRIAARILSGRR